ncbi:phosphoenolpyruvate carboxykinase domain-containing protein, partial [Brevundimonas sp.]
WFRKDQDGKFVWPGFGDNIRVLKWVVDRLEGKGEAVTTPVGHVPSREALDLSGVELTEAQLSTLLDVDADVWTEEASLIPAFYEKFAGRLPAALWDQHAALSKRLEDARAARLAAE